MNFKEFDRKNFLDDCHDNMFSEGLVVDERTNLH